MIRIPESGTGSFGENEPEDTFVRSDVQVDYLFQWPEIDWLPVWSAAALVWRWYGWESLLAEEVIARWARDGLVPARAVRAVERSSSAPRHLADFLIPPQFWEGDWADYHRDFWVSGIAEVQCEGWSGTLYDVELDAARLRACAEDLFPELHVASAAQNWNEAVAWISQCTATRNVNEGWKLYSRGRDRAHRIKNSDFLAEWTRIHKRGKGRPKR